MPISLRLDNDLEKIINQTAKRLNLNKTEIIRRSITKYLSDVEEKEKTSLYELYRKFEEKIPGSGHGLLSIQHRKEVLKRIKRKV